MIFFDTLFRVLITTNVSSMWLEDLAKLEVFLDAMDQEDQKMHARDNTKQKVKPMKKPKPVKTAMVEESKDSGKKKGPK